MRGINLIASVKAALGVSYMPDPTTLQSSNFKYGRTVSARNKLSQKGRRKRAKWSRKK